MTVLNDTRYLNSANLQTIIEVAASDLERRRPLTFLDRLTLVPAMDDELMGRFTPKQFAADIIPDGQKALVYDAGQIEIVTTQLPNIKIGQNLNQSQINLLNRIANGTARTAEEDAAFDWEVRFGENLLQGVRERMNQLACAMMLDTFSYDRWGVIFTASWGMPSNLKVTPSVLWSSDSGATANVSATPIANFFAMDILDSNTYGLGPFDRITMSSTAFDFMVTTTEFANKAWATLGANFLLTPAALKTADRPEMMSIAQRVLGKEIVIDDKTIREQNNAGVTSPATRVLPVNKVLLDRKSNGAREWDFGNGVVTESLVADLLGGGPVLGENPQMLGGGAYGPLAYYTGQSPDLNPPGVNGWAVSRSFPRRHVIECSAVLTVW